MSESRQEAYQRVQEVRAAQAREKVREEDWWGGWFIILLLMLVAATFVGIGMATAVKGPSSHQHKGSLPKGIMEISPSEYWTPLHYPEPGNICGDYYNSIRGENGGWHVVCSSGQHWNVVWHTYRPPWSAYGGGTGGAVGFMLLIGAVRGRQLRVRHKRADAELAKRNLQDEIVERERDLALPHMEL